MNAASGLQLLPKSASAGLPTIEVFSLTGNRPVWETKKSYADFYSPAAGTATGNLFDGFTGSVIGRVSFRTPIGPETLKKVTFSGVAAGARLNDGPRDHALIKFNVVANEVFVQGD